MNDEGLRRLMQSVMTSYVMYYNRRHNTSGPLFRGPYRANPIEDEQQLKWTIAYVHSNHPSGPEYKYSTHNAYVNPDETPGWLQVAKPLNYFGGVDEYRTFMRMRAHRQDLNDFFFNTYSQ